MHVGKKIKMIRALKGFTQSDLAEKINKTRSMVSHIEQTGKVNHYTLLSLLKAFNMTEQELENFDGKVVVNEQNPNSDYTKSETELLKQKIDHCMKEIEMLKELVRSQKRIIKMLERKKR